MKLRGKTWEWDSSRFDLKGSINCTLAALGAAGMLVAHILDSMLNLTLVMLALFVTLALIFAHPFLAVVILLFGLFL